MVGKMFLILFLNIEVLLLSLLNSNMILTTQTLELINERTVHKKITNVTVSRSAMYIFGSRSFETSQDGCMLYISILQRASDG